MTVRSVESGKQSDVESIPASGPEAATTAEQINGEREMLEEEITCYRSNLADWRVHQGKHVLIQGGTVHGFFGSRNDALREGLRRFGRIAFLVKEVDVDEKPRPLVQVLL